MYSIIFGTSLFNAPWHDLALQAVVHGLLVAVISFVCIGRAVSILGASNGSAFAALAPVITALLAIPILGEWPATSDWIAMLLISGWRLHCKWSPAPGPTEFTRFACKWNASLTGDTTLRRSLHFLRNYGLVEPSKAVPMSELDPDRIATLTFDCYGTLIDWETGTIQARDRC